LDPAIAKERREDFVAMEILNRWWVYFLQTNKESDSLPQFIAHNVTGMMLQSCCKAEHVIAAWKQNI